MAAEPQEISEIQSRFRQELVQEPQCVVVLLGWLGSVDKYVAKYASSLYTPMGCSSVRTTVGGWDMYFNWKNCADTLQAGIDLAGSVAPGVPIVVHAFSNGGCSGVSALLARAESEGADSEAALTLAKVASWVFDSCPAYLHTATGAGAVAEGFTNPIAKGIAYGGMFAVLGTATFFAPTVAQDFWAPLLHNSLPAPQLYLYSGDDALTQCVDLEPLMAERRTNGFPVHALKFEQSPHVSHFRKYPGIYSTAIAAVVQQACSSDAPAHGSETLVRALHALASSDSVRALALATQLADTSAAARVESSTASGSASYADVARGSTGTPAAGALWVESPTGVLQLSAVVPASAGDIPIQAAPVEQQADSLSVKI